MRVTLAVPGWPRPIRAERRARTSAFRAVVAAARGRPGAPDEGELWAVFDRLCGAKMTPITECLPNGEALTMERTK